MSVAVVTIAIIFAGYQIAFAHKRISDVAPILIGGVLIGAAGQIAKMLVGNADSCSAGTTSAMLQVLQFLPDSHHAEKHRFSRMYASGNLSRRTLYTFLYRGRFRIIDGNVLQYVFLLTIPFIILIMRQMAKRDDMIFRFLGLRLKFRLKARNREEFPDTWCFSPNEYRNNPPKQ